MANLLATEKFILDPFPGLTLRMSNSLRPDDVTNPKICVKFGCNHDFWDSWVNLIKRLQA